MTIYIGIFIYTYIFIYVFVYISWLYNIQFFKLISSIEKIPSLT